MAVCTGFDLTILTSLIAKYEDYNYVVSAKIMSSHEVRSQIEENKSDIGIVGFSSHEPPIHSKAAYSEQIVLAGMKRVEVRDFTDLYSIPLIFHQKGSGLREFVTKALKSLGIEPERLIIRYEVGYEDFSIAASKRGYGYAFVSERHLGDGLYAVWGTGVKELLRSFWYLSKDSELLEAI
jgi:DNA-binding transcriptional LysR family regulator